MRGKFKLLEQERGKPMAQILKEEFEQHGSQTAVANVLGISQGTLSYWLLKLDLQQVTVLRPMERV